MQPTASLDQVSPALSNLEITPDDAAGSRVVVNRDTLDAKSEARRWSMFERGGPAAASSMLDEPKYLQANDAFWDALGHNDVKAAKKVLRKLSVLERERLFRTPCKDVASDVWAPKLPLCRAVAGGLLEMTELLLSFHADPYVGDAWVGDGSADNNDVKQPAATPAYWGVIYGQTPALRAIYKQTRSTLEARRALCQAVQPEVLTWLVGKGLTPEQLAPAMRVRVKENDAAGVRLLAKIGKANVNAEVPTADTQTTTCSLLAYAIASNSIDAAEVLVEYGAHPANRKTDPAPEGSPPAENFPLMAAVKKGQVGLVIRMLQAHPKEAEQAPGIASKAEPVSEAAYLSAAFECPQPVEMYISLYRAGVSPRQLVEVERLIEQAKERELDFLYAFIVHQRTMLLLQREKKITDDAKKAAKQRLDVLADALAKSPGYASPTPLVARAQAMTLEADMPQRSMFNVFHRWGAKKSAKAGGAIADAALNLVAPDFGPANGNLMLGM